MVIESDIVAIVVGFVMAIVVGMGVMEGVKVVVLLIGIEEVKVLVLSVVEVMIGIVIGKMGAIKVDDFIEAKL